MTTEVTTPEAAETAETAETPCLPDRTVDRVAELERRRAAALAPGGPRRRGEFGARERIERLLDPGSFTETGQFVRARTADGTGHAAVR